MGVKRVVSGSYSAEFEAEEDGEVLVFVCRGENGCGATMFSEDRQRHANHHADIWGRLAGLEANSG